MKRKSALLALLLAPLAAAAVPRGLNEATQTARDVAQRSDQELQTIWEDLSRGLDSLKSAQHPADVTAVLSLARSSTNGLARITNNIEVFQDRLLTVMSNEIDRQPLDRTVKQELHGYVENDLQSLESVKSIACEDLDAIASFLAHHQTEWTAMIDVLSRMYPDADCMQIMQKHFSAAADELRSKIESHRSLSPADEPAVSAAEPAPAPDSPPPAAVSSAAPSLPPIVDTAPAAPQVPSPDPNEIIAQDRALRDNPPAPQVEEPFGAAVGLSEPARRIGLLVRKGYSDRQLAGRIKHSGPFDLTGDQIIYLKASGVSEDLVTAMLKRDRALRD